MEKLSIGLKKILLASIMLLFISLSVSVHAQTSIIDFKFKIDSIKNEGVTTYNITITITKGEAPFTVGIYEDLLQKGLVELDKKENSTENNISLTFTGRKNCLIYVRNNKDAVAKPLILK